MTAWYSGIELQRTLRVRLPNLRVPYRSLSLLRLAAYALAEGAVEGDFGEGALENGEFLVVQLRKE